jgi:hypothetical protein
MAKFSLMRSVFPILSLGLLCLTTAACGVLAKYFTPPPATTTLMAGWEHRFALDWTVTPQHDGSSLVQGYVSNLNGERAISLRVMARGVDSQGQMRGQQIAWVFGGVPGFSRTYFNIPQVPQTDSYVVTVWDYTLFQAPTTLP